MLGIILQCLILKAFFILHAQGSLIEGKYVESNSRILLQKRFSDFLCFSPIAVFSYTPFLFLHTRSLSKRSGLKRQQTCHVNRVSGMSWGRVITRWVGAQKHITTEVFDPGAMTRHIMPFWVLVRWSARGPRLRGRENFKCTRLTNVKSEYDPWRK